MFDFEPATRTLTRLVVGVTDDQIDQPTPCAGTSVGALLDHLDGVAVGFAEAAAKTGGSQGPSADASRLGDDFRSRIAGRLASLAEAWKDESAWTGTTKVAGSDFPGEVAARIAADEVVVHGWDLAVATGQSADWPPDLVDAAIGFVEPLVGSNPDGVPGLFDPALPARGTEPLDRLLALTGRDPSWPRTSSAD